MCIKNKWFFKIKHNDVYKVHHVMYEYSQVPNVDFSEKYPPVFNHITFCILLLMVLQFGYLAKIVDIETAFLYGFPQGMSNVVKDDYIILNNCIYGIVQAAR